MAKTFRQRFSLKYKLSLVFIPIVLSVGLFVFYASSVSDNINSSFSKINKSFDSLTDVVDLKTAVENLSSATEIYANSQDLVWREKHAELLVIFNGLYTKITPTEDWKEGTAIMKEFKKTTDDLQKAETLSLQMVKAGDIAGAKRALDSQYTNNLSLAGNLLYSFLDKGRENVSTEITNSQNFLATREIFFIALGFLFLLVTLLVMAKIFNTQILGPIQKLAKTTKIIADGNMTFRAEIASRDEIGSLAYDFNVMLDRLQFSHSLLNTTINDLDKANHELKKIDQMKSDFITVAAHQLRTPLTGIKWSLTSIISGNMGPVRAEQAEYLKGAIESNQRMIDTVNQIMRMSNIQDGSLGEKRVPVDLANLLNSVLFDIYPHATQKGIKINVKVDRDSLPDIEIDQSQMRVILQSLIENSIIYSKEKGEVDICIERDNKSVIVSVKDYGVGIPEGEKKNIFSKFFRATNAIKHFANGSGLGLLITKKIIERNSGRIWFESEEEKGTTFYVSLPIENT
jgi:signal transduction histidine kinase